MKMLSERLKEYHLERLVWCLAVVAFCWTDVADYYHMTYNKMLCVWIALGVYYLYKQGAFKRENRVVSCVLGIIGCIVLGFFVYTNYFSGYTYYNYTLGLMAIVLLLQYGMVIRNFIKNHKLPGYSTAASLLLLMMLYMQFSPLTDKNSYLVMFLILLPYAGMEVKVEERQDIFKGMIDGLCVGFILCQGYTFLFRPYMFTENGSRFKAFRDYCTFAGMSYLQFYLGYLLKYIMLCKAGGAKWYKTGLFLIASFILSLLYLTGGRSPLLGVMAITAILFAWLYRELPWRKAVLYWFRKCICIGALSLVLFPVAFAGTRYLPTILNHPDLQDSEGNRLYSFATVVLQQTFLYNGEWNDQGVKASDPWDSVKYVTFPECVSETLGRVVPGLSRVLYPVIGEEVIEAKAARLQYFCEMGYITDSYALDMMKSYCNQYNQPMPEYFKALDCAYGSTEDELAIVVYDEESQKQRKEEKSSANLSGVFLPIKAAELNGLYPEDESKHDQLGRGDSIEYGWFAEDEEYNSMQLRNAIHLFSLGKLNLTGHEKFSYKMYYQTGSEQYLGHAHNIFLIIGYDYGIPAMVLMALTFVVITYASLKRGIKRDEACYLLPAVLVIAMAVFGWYESGFSCGNSFSLLIFLCCVLWREEKS